MSKALLALLLLGACTRRSAEPPPQAVPDSFVVTMAWDCRDRLPQVRFRDGTLLGERLMVAHHLAHVRQALRLGCDSWDQALEDSARLAELEEQARLESCTAVLGEDAPCPAWPYCVLWRPNDGGSDAE